MSGGRIRPGSIRPKEGYSFNDGLINAVSGMGTTTDPRTYSRYFATYFSDAQIDAAYRGSWVMRKVIDKPAVEMVREWRDWQADSADIEKLEAEEKRLDICNKIKRAEVLRGLGGAGVVLYVGGSDDEQAQPLDPKRIRAGDLTQVHVWHRSKFTLGDVIEDWGDPWFGHPSYFEVRLTSKTIRFHPSRVAAFRAEQVPDIIGTDWTTQFWGQSRVQTIIDAVTNVDMADGGFAALIKDARNRRIYIPGLLDMVSTAEGEGRLAKRLQAFALGESSNRVSWLDGGTVDESGKLVNAEKIEDRQMSWAGMPDIMNAYRTAAAAAADMPATVLWGTSPQGMNATGESDLAIWRKTIRGRQDLDLRPCMTQIDAALIPSALGKVDDTIWYEWAPLETQSEKDEATTFFTFMQGVEKLQATGALPDIAFEKGLQNAIEERGWLPGVSDALAELGEDERFPSLAEPDETDPSVIQEGGDPSLAPGGADGSQAARRRANDAEGEQRRPFGDTYDPSQPRNKYGEWTSSGAMRILQHVTKVLSGKGNHPALSLGKVSEANAALVKQRTGFDLSGHERVLESSDIRHVMASHSNAEKEAGRGQVAITKADFSNIPVIVESAHTVALKGEGGSKKPQRLVYNASIGGHEYEYVEEIRGANKIVALKTMWKR